MSLHSNLNRGSNDPYVVIVQRQLVELGYRLPRFGVDGDLGDETLTAYGTFLISQGLGEPADERPDSITPLGADALEKAYAALTKNGLNLNIIDERANHPHAGRSVSMPYRPWANITAVVLHQTAAKMGENPSSWHSVPIHFGVTREDKLFSSTI